jgi:hypothetical protein
LFSVSMLMTAVLIGLDAFSPSVHSLSQPGGRPDYIFCLAARIGRVGSKTYPLLGAS